VKYASVSIEAIQGPAIPVRNEASHAMPLQKLADSMALIGQLQPIGVTETAGGFTLVFGGRRLQAARLLGWKDIETCILGLSSETQALVVYLAGNWHHEPLRALQNIQAIQRLADTGLSASQMAQMLSCSPDWLADHIAVARDPVARSMAQAGILPDARNLRHFEALPKRIRKLLIETL